jgi:hypothetical protein
VYLVVGLLLVPRLPALIGGILLELDVALRAAVLSMFQGWEAELFQVREELIDILAGTLHGHLRVMLAYAEAVQFVLDVNLSILLAWVHQFGIPLIRHIGEYLQGWRRFIDWAVQALTWALNALGLFVDVVTVILGGVGSLVLGDLILPDMPPETGLPTPGMIPHFPDLYADAIAPVLPELTTSLDHLGTGATEAFTLVVGAAQGALADVATLSEEEMQRSIRIGRPGVVQGIVGTAGEISDLALGTEARSARARAAARARTSFERWLTTGGGFTVIGDVLPEYISEMERWWRAEKERLPTSPHVLRRNMRLARVVSARVTIRAPGRELNDTLTEAVAARFREATQCAYRQANALVSAAPE